MYVAPNTDIVFCYGVPLDDTYEHTILFYDRNNADGRSWQSYYFNQKWAVGGHRYTGQSYQDPNDNIIRVEAPFSAICNSNYMFFENKSHGPTYQVISNPTASASSHVFVTQSKRYYCFVKKVRYLNESVTEVEFEVDVMQTYMFDYQLKECFIDREHDAYDTDGANTIPEDLDCGTSLVINDHVDFDLNDSNGMRVCILVNGRPAGSTVGSGTSYNGIYSGCRAITQRAIYDGQTTTYVDLYASDYENINGVLGEYLPEDIVAIFQYPSKARMYIVLTNGEPHYDEIFIPAVGKEFKKKESEPAGYPTYLAKNNKMKCYPYSRMMVSDNNGHVEEYKYEQFYDTVIYNGAVCYKFSHIGMVLTESACIIMPNYYAGKSLNYDEAMILSNFPQCSWAGDTFKSWWAQNKNQYQTAMLGTIIGGVFNTAANAFSGNVGGALMAPVNAGIAIDMQLAKKADIKNMPNATHGVSQTNSISCTLQKYKFSFYEMKIKPEYAKIIDQYFSRFGYKTNKIKVPNRRARRYWTYTRTVQCAITETLGNDIAKKICSIYDNGITFWRYYDSMYNNNTEYEPRVGEYSFYEWDNSPLNYEGA